MLLHKDHISEFSNGISCYALHQIDTSPRMNLRESGARASVTSYRPYVLLHSLA